MFDAKISQPDEDGYCLITILEDGKELDRHSIRYDQAAQWAAQELECLEAGAEAEAAGTTAYEMHCQAYEQLAATVGPMRAAEMEHEGDLPF